MQRNKNMAHKRGETIQITPKETQTLDLQERFKSPILNVFKE